MSYIKKRKSKKAGTIVPEMMTDERTFTEWMAENANTLIYGGGAILLVLFITLGFFYVKSHKEQAASVDMDNALRLYWNTVAKQPSDDADADRMALEQALDTFKEVSDNYGSKVQGQAASVYQSRILYRLGRYAEAAELLEKVRSSHPAFASDVDALYLLGKSYEAADELQKAIGIYTQMRNDSVGELKAVLAVDIARCSELTGDVQEAISLYKEVLADYPDTVLAARSEKKLVTLGVFDREEI